MNESAGSPEKLRVAPVFVDDQIQIFEGEQALERLAQKNDGRYLTTQGVVRVDSERWREAQRYEKKTWLERAVSADDDRNHDHYQNFQNYEAVAGRAFPRILELGCGPFTNLRLILPKIPRPQSVTLLDPLIESYLNHPHCTYRSKSLLGVPVDLVALPIEELAPKEPYDLVVMVNVLEHCFNVPRIFEVILQCLKPGGTFIFGDNTFRQDQLSQLLSQQYDAGHPIRVEENYLRGFLAEHFQPRFQNAYFGRYQQPHRVDLYFIGDKLAQPAQAQGASIQQVGASSAKPTIHFVYSGNPMDDRAIRAPGTITNRLFRFLEKRGRVKFYDWTDTSSPVEVGPEDIVLGHPHVAPDSIMRRLVKASCAGKHLIFPFHSRIPEIARFVKEIALDCDKLFLISGPFWTDSIEQTEYRDWKPKIVRLDNAVDLSFFTLQKRSFNPPGKRGYFVLGRSGPEKGTSLLFNLLRDTTEPVLVAGEFSAEDRALLEGRPNTEYLGVIDWRDQKIRRHILDKCDFLLNLSVSDASPTALFETMALGLIAITTPQCGYYYPSFLLLSLENMESNRLVLAQAQMMSEEQLRSRQKENREYLEQCHSWDRFCSTLWEAIHPTRDAVQREARKCWCGGELNSSVHPLYGRCHSCGAHVLHRNYSPADLASFYTLDHYWHEHQVSISKYPPIEERAVNDLKDRVPFWHGLLKSIKPTITSLLEIGCAHGGFLDYSRKNGVQRVVGVEVDAATCEFAKKHFQLPEVYSGLFPDVKLPEGKFEAVTGFDVLEHFLDPVCALQHVCELMADDGIFLFQTPCYRGEADKWVQFRPTEHIFLYDPKSIHQLFHAAGLEITEIIPGYFPDDMFVVGRKHRPVRKLVFLRPDAIGDNLLAASMLPHLAAKYPEAEITVVCQRHIAELYETCPFVQRIVTFDKAKLAEDPNYRQTFAAELKSLQADLCLNSVYSREAITDWLAFVCEAKESIAHTGDLSNISPTDRDANNARYTRVVPDFGAGRAELDRHRDFLNYLGIFPDKLEPLVWTDNEDECFAEEYFQRHGLKSEDTIALFAGAQWDMRRYSSYGKALAETAWSAQGTVIALGSLSDAEINRQNLNQSKARALDFTGRTTLRQSAAILKRCRLAIGAETGLAHLACAVGTPQVILLGGGHFGRFMPYSPLTSVACLPLKCYGCNWRCSFPRHHCVKDLSPGVLSAAISQTLEGVSDRPRVFFQDRSSWQHAHPAWSASHSFLNPDKFEIIPVSTASPEAPENSPAIVENCGAPLSEPARLCLEQAEKHFRECNWQIARDYLSRAVDIESARPELWLGLANLEAKLENVGAACDAMAGAIRLSPSNSDWHFILASLRLRQGDVASFEQSMQRSLELNPENASALEFLGNLSLEAGQLEDAACFYRRVLAKDPGNASCLSGLGKCLAQQPERPLISVLVSVYKSERFIRQCLEGLLAQTISAKLEIIVIDSGSPENERSIVEEFQRQHPNIRYLRTERETLYAAWNRGIALARGNYITNANCDDGHRLDAMELMAAALEANPEADLAYANCLWTSVPNDRFPDPHVLREVRYPSYEPALSLFYSVSGCFPMWRRNVFEKIGLFDSALTAVGDYEFLLRFAFAGLKAVHVPEFLSLFYQNPAGLTQGATVSRDEENEIRARYRREMAIEKFFKIDANSGATRSDAWLSLGALAMACPVPWLDQPLADVAFACECFEHAVQEDSANLAAIHNLICALHLNGRGSEVREWLPKLSPDRSAALQDDLARGQVVFFEKNCPPAAMGFEFPFEPLVSPQRTATADQPATPGRAFATLAGRSASTVAIRWMGPIFNPSGYASEALNFLIPLADRVEIAAQHHNNLYSKDYVAGLPAAERHLLFEMRDRFPRTHRGIVISHNPANGFLCLPDAEHNVGRTMYESDRIPSGWVGACNRMDEVWVPSRFNVETFAGSGVEREKLIVIPGAVDAEHFNPERHKPLSLPNAARFNFLAIFEWSARKGWDVLLASYLREFSAEDDVCLYLRTYLFSKPDGDPTVVLRSRIRDFADSLDLGTKPWPRIEILAEQVSSADLPRLYLGAQCLVAPSRGEGWGRPHHEAMMMGVPVIATGWSGNTEFMTEDNSFLLEYELGPAKALESEILHYTGHCWANPSESHLRKLMRQVEQNPSAAREKGQKARNHVLKNFSREPVADLVTARLREIEKKLTTPALPAVLARRLEASAGSRQAAKPLLVAWEGTYLDNGSLSHVNRELTAVLGRSKQIVLTCVGKNTVTENVRDSAAIEAVARRLSAVAPKRTEFVIRHQWPPNWQRPDHGTWIVIQPWEYGALPESWLEALRNVDEIWVYSEYVRQVYVGSGVDPQKVRVVPLGIDPQKFRPDAPPLALGTAKKFKFLFVGGTIHRKGADLLLKAYLGNFSAADDVCLVIKDFGGKTVYAGQTLEQQIRATQAKPGAPEILYLDHDFVPDALPGLYTACDCLVHPYRGEGFGLPVLEAMACGLPVIVTGGGATDDFATDEFAYRIPSRRVSIGMKVGEFALTKPGWLLEPCVDHLARSMKQVLSRPNEAKAKGQAASEHVRKCWTWDRAARVVADRLQQFVDRQAAAAQELAARRARKGARIELPAAARLGDLQEARRLLAEKNFLEAAEAAFLALDERPFHPPAWLLLGEIALAAGDIQRAKIWLQRALALAPEWKTARKLLKALPHRDGQTLAWAQRTDLHDPPRLTVCLIVKNEEKHLARCLASIRSLAWQIVVADTGSTDRTVEIAREFGAEVTQLKWANDFSRARNAALEKVRGDWVLVLDADEELMADQDQVLREAMSAPGVLAYRLPMIDKGREEEGVSYVPRLFCNAPGLFFVGRIHEQIFSSIEVRRAEWGMDNRLGAVQLFHHGYTKEMVASREKIGRNLQLLGKAMEELPNEPNLVMNYGLELTRAGQLELGLQQYSEAFQLLSEMPPQRVVPELRETLLTQFASQLMAARNFSQIVEILQSPLAQAGGLTATHHFYLGLAFMELKRPAEGAEQMRLCTQTRNEPALSPIHKDIRKGGPAHCLALCLAVLKQTDSARAAFQQALAEDPSARGIRFDWAKFLAAEQQPLEALQILHQLVSEDARDCSVWEFGAAVAMSRPEFAEFAADWLGEACKLFPKKIPFWVNRAEALMFSGKFQEARLIWDEWGEKNSPRHSAARIVCALAVNGPDVDFADAQVPAVSREFVVWHRKLLAAGAGLAVKKIHAEIGRLRAWLPPAADILEQALASIEA